MTGEFKGTRGEAINYIPQLINEGFTNTQITNWLRENELSYRTSYMFQDINRLRLENMGADFIRNLDRDTPVPDRMMRTWHGETEHQYRVVIKYEYFDTSTQTTGTSGTTLYFDHPPSQREVLDFFDIRRQSIENLYNNVQEVYGATHVYYYRNEQ